MVSADLVKLSCWSPMARIDSSASRREVSAGSFSGGVVDPLLLPGDAGGESLQPGGDGRGIRLDFSVSFRIGGLVDAHRALAIGDKGALSLGVQGGGGGQGGEVLGEIPGVAEVLFPEFHLEIPSRGDG